MTVVAAAEYEGTIRAGTTVQRSAILDMTGPGAEISRFSSLLHLVLSFRIVPGLAELEAHTAIQSAEYKSRTDSPKLRRDCHRRRSSRTTSAARIRSAERDAGAGSITDPQHVHSGVGYYGLSLRDSMATFVHPNELFDGAVTVDTTRSGRGYYPTTWIGKITLGPGAVRGPRAKPELRRGHLAAHSVGRPITAKKWALKMPRWPMP